MAEGFDPATLYRYIVGKSGTGGRSPATEVPALDQLGKLIAALEGEAGSGRKAAAAAGVPETSWRRWRSGSGKPSGPQLAKLEAARQDLRVRVRRRRLNPARETKLRARPPSVTVTWTMTISSDVTTRRKKFPGEYVDKELWQDMWAAVIADYLAGGDGSEPVEQMIETAITEYANGQYDYHALDIEKEQWHYQQLR